MKYYEPEIWGPCYWSFLHHVAETYPKHPNDTMKRKYYDLIMNLPLYIPNEAMSNNFSHLLDKYPVSPYLTNRDSFKRWVYFIHNKINLQTGKRQISYEESQDLFYAQYKPKQIKLSEKFHIKQHYIQGFFTIGVIVYAIYLHNKKL